MAEEITETEVLLVTKILATLQQQPAGLFQHRVTPFAFHAAGFLGADLVERLVHFGDDVEPVENVQRLGTFLLDDLQIWLPHIRADEGDLGDDLLAHGGEEFLEGFDGSFSPDPEQAGDADVDLVDQGQVLVAFGVLDFIDANGVDLTERAMLQSPRRRHVPPHRTPCPRKCESTLRFLSTKAGAPNGLGKAYRPWSGCVCRRPRGLPRRSPCRTGGNRRDAWRTAGRRRIPTEE